MPFPQDVNETVLGHGSAEVQQEDLEDLPWFRAAEFTGFQDCAAALDPQWTEDPDDKGCWWQGRIRS
jgi:hypothetical protein